MNNFPLTFMFLLYYDDRTNSKLRITLMQMTLCRVNCKINVIYSTDQSLKHSLFEL